jgi:GNAT superfamily N-acetyltransferase
MAATLALDWAVDYPWGRAMDIVEFEPAHAEAFRTLNEAWIETYFALEAKDREVLGQPQLNIIDKGGRIFMAMLDGAPVGCVALMKMADGGFEVAKMTVAETLRGSGLGRRLMQRRIDAGAEAGATRLYLETSSHLAPALALYRAMGFRDLPPTETPYVRADVFMERPY